MFYFNNRRDALNYVRQILSRFNNAPLGPVFGIGVLTGEYLPHNLEDLKNLLESGANVAGWCEECFKPFIRGDRSIISCYWPTGLLPSAEVGCAAAKCSLVCPEAKDQHLFTCWSQWWHEARRSGIYTCLRLEWREPKIEIKLIASPDLVYAPIRKDLQWVDLDLAYRDFLSDLAEIAWGLKVGPSGELA